MTRYLNTSFKNSHKTKTYQPKGRRSADGLEEEEIEADYSLEFLDVSALAEAYGLDCKISTSVSLWLRNSKYQCLYAYQTKKFLVVMSHPL